MQYAKKITCQITVQKMIMMRVQLNKKQKVKKWIHILEICLPITDT